MLQIENIHKKYQQQEVLKDVNFDFKPGSIYGIIGPNGAGKSTLLRILAGFESPSQGKIILSGKKLSEPSPLISCMWQKPYLFQTTVYNNIAYGLKIRGLKRKVIADRIADIIEKFRLEKLVSKLAVHLSGGEAARVALARAIACDSPIILLDEPAANLDPPNTRMIEDTLLQVQKEKELTVIVVTHDMFQARRLAHYTLFMENGLLVEAQPSEELFANPHQESTKRFLQGLL